MEQTPETKKWSRIILQIAVLAGGALLMAIVASIPFLFESPSLYYKMGMDKIFLRAGKVLGLIAALLIFSQVLHVSRISFLEKLFSLKGLFRFHRISGKLIAVLVILHPLFIMAAENFTFFPFEKRYWPEFVGAGLLLLILGVVIISVWQSGLGLSRNTWQGLHRWLTPVIVFFLFVHILFVSESFNAGWPRAGLFLVGGGAVLLFFP
ncbi:MAG: hypothetical protein QM498_05290, partial [Desulfobacterium sp.]